MMMMRLILSSLLCGATLLAVSHSLTRVGPSEKLRKELQLQRKKRVIMLALREEPISLASRRSPSLEEPPPANLSTEERSAWFAANFPRFKFLHSDSLSATFASRAKRFFNSSACSQSQRFFMTWISHHRYFGPRERLAIESLFKWNPTACLLILSRSLDSPAGNRILRPFLRKGFKVSAMAPDLRFLAKGTPVEDWFRGALEVQRGFDPGDIPFAQNLSNILRIVALFRYGGIYLDTDVIVLRNLSHLCNAIGAQNVDNQSGRWNRLNNAVVAMEREHPLLLLLMKDFAVTFNGSRWGHNGPYLLTRVLSRSLPGNGFKSVRILPPNAFYPVDWSRIRVFFSGAVSEKWRVQKLKRLEAESSALHLWNKHTRALNVERGSLIHLLFSRHCIFCEYFLNVSSSSVNVLPR